MENVPTALERLLLDSDFSSCHTGIWADIPVRLRRFLASTMDEVRITTSNRITLDLLGTTGIADSQRFREAVLKREWFGSIAYDKQRDHSSHTLYNYLLGWYFWSNCPAIKYALQKEFKNRGVSLANARYPFTSDAEFFHSVWLYASVLHDIGYMFEGSISSKKFEESAHQARIGANVARDYFRRGFWLEHGLETPEMRELLFTDLGPGLEPPAFDNCDGLADIGSSLRWLGKLDMLRTEAGKEYGSPINELSGDAFNLWTTNYEYFHNPSMAARIGSLRRVFNGLIDGGLPKVDIRLLDHGVCGGLLQLLASTYHYRVVTKAREVSSPGMIVNGFLQSAGEPSFKFWWSGIAWATAAVALHNVQQMPEAKEIDPGWPGALSLSDDPLTYLGVLVDIIQDWNRYSVFRSINLEPTQGIDVGLEMRENRVVVNFKNSDPRRSDKLKKDLNNSLQDWSSLVELLP